MDLVKVPFHKPASGKLGLTGRLGVPKQHQAQARPWAGADG